MARSASPAASPDIAPAASRIDWLDVLKGLAILVVLAYHFWPPGSGRATGAGMDGLPAVASRIWGESRSAARSLPDAIGLSLAAVGYQGVHLFLVISGFALAASEARRGRAEASVVFYKRRLARLLPPYYAWILVLAIIGAINARLHLGTPFLVGLSREDLLVNLLLVRNFSEKWVWVYPGTMWFVPLILQMYLLYPFVAAAMRRRPPATLAACALITLAYRAVAVIFFDGVPAGNVAGGHATPLLFAPARLWEFALGIWLAQRFAAPASTSSSSSKGAGERRALESWPMGLLVAGSAAVYALGLFSAHNRAGLVVSDPLLGTGGFGLALAASRILAGVAWLRAPLSYLGRNSYTIFLSHSLLMPTALAFERGDNAYLGFGLFVAAAAILSFALDKLLQVAGIVWVSVARRLPRTPSVAEARK